MFKYNIGVYPYWQGVDKCGRGGYQTLVLSPSTRPSHTRPIWDFLEIAYGAYEIHAQSDPKLQHTAKTHKPILDQP